MFVPTVGMKSKDTAELSATYAPSVHGMTAKDKNSGKGKNLSLLGKALKGLAKLVIGKSASKASDEGVGILDVVDDVIDNDQEVQSAIQGFIVSFEGKYSELRTKFEGVVRTMLRPILTLGVVTNIIIMVWKEITIPQILGWMGVILVSSWCGTKAFRDWKKARPPKV